MPRILRSMEKDGESPQIGERRCQLGVRPPGGQSRPDVSLDAAGNVKIGLSGLSVADHPRSMDPALIPVRLRQHFPGAIGKDSLHIWSHGQGTFVSGPVSMRLELFVEESSGHGFVRPTEPLTLQQFQSALADTRPDWTISEPGT
jgi:hypothetical protein